MHPDAALIVDLRKQPTRRTSWKLVGNPGWQPGFQTSWQLVRNFTCWQPDRSRHAGWQLAAQVECRKRPGLQQVAN